MLRIHIDDLCTKTTTRLLAQHLNQFILVIRTGKEIQVDKSDDILSFSHEYDQLTQLEELDCSKAQEILMKS